MVKTLPMIALVTLSLLSGTAIAVPPTSPPVMVTDQVGEITLDNGIVSITLGKKERRITAIRYRHDGVETQMAWTMYWSTSSGPTDPAVKAKVTVPPGSTPPRDNNAPTPRVVRNAPDAAEVVMESGPSLAFPYHVETHYLLPRETSGFYAYQVYSRTADQPAAFLGEARFVIKGPEGTALYTNHVVDEKRMGPFDTSPVVRPVMDATSLLQDGTVYTKYNNTAFMGDHYVHGMTGHGVGIWMVNASNEYITGGPLKQELTVHMGNTLLNMLQGAHFGSGVLNFAANEPWRKVYGPFFVYMNAGSSTEVMYQDALHRATSERQQWPYHWVNDPDYPLTRSTVTGQVHLTGAQDSVAGAWAVLAAPGGAWPLQGKGYEFWAKTDSNGRFAIPHVRPGRYTLYVCGANQFEQFSKDNIDVPATGGAVALGTLDWTPITHGRTLWQIGIADRSSAEFHGGDDVRHWANFLRYPADFPEDVTFTVGKSQEKADWNFAQWTWYSKKPYWTIRFPMEHPVTGKATLTLGIAASNPVGGNNIDIEVRVNGLPAGVAHLTKSGAAAYRSGGQDSLYQVEYVPFDASLLKPGMNEITLGLSHAVPFPSVEEQWKGHVGAVMYDAIRLEVAEPIAR